MIATSLTDVDDTLHRLLVIELLVTAVVLAAIMLLGLWIVGSACGRSMPSRARQTGSPPATSRAASSAPRAAPRSAGSGSR